MPITGEDRVRQTTESFASTLEKLIRRFESDRPHYLSKGYSEAQARVDFVTPFFKALGWDVENEEGLPHHSREVVVEAAEDTEAAPTTVSEYRGRRNSLSKQRLHPRS